MAAEAAVSSSGLPLCPSFAVVCSFLERYGAALDLPEMSFPEMESYLRDTSSVPKPLVELHVKLLRKLGKMVSVDRWEKYLAKVCQELNSTWAWELEQRGYQEMTMECKSGILKYLCESQFDDNLKFKMAVNEEEPERMRLEPIGRDHRGHLYWLQLDQDHNIRMYMEEQDDLHGATWRCIVRSRKELEAALKLLKAQSDPNFSQTELPHNPSLEEDNSSTEIKKTDNQKSESLKEEPVTTEIQPHFPKTEQTPERSEVMPPVCDHHVRTITAVREERPFQNTVSVLRAPSAFKPEAPVSMVRSSQATIPLKKRELKLSQDYHSNHRNNTSSIIVLNPAVIHRAGLELTNGQQSPLLHKSGPGAAFNHVGVIRSIQSQPEQTPVRRESVLVQKAVEISRESPVLPLVQNDLKKDPVVKVDLGQTNEAKDKQSQALDLTGEKPQSIPDRDKVKTEVNGAVVSDKLKEEASSELQKEGIRLKIKIPPQRQGKIRGRGVKRQQRTVEDEPRLRRSARISRPSSKVAESQRKRAGRRKGPPRPPVKPVQTRKRRGRPKWTSVKKPKVKQEVQEELPPEPEQLEQAEGETELSPADACTHCGEAVHPELILLCDLCDRGFHTACLRPPLMLVPDGEWFCPPCQHKQLCERLEEQLSCLDSALKRQEMAERRRERLVYVGISVENILPGRQGDKETPKKKDVRRSRQGRRSTRARKNISYRFDDFDDAINEAIEDNRDLNETHSKLIGSVSDEGIDIKQPLTDQAVKRTEIQRPIRWPAGRIRKKRRLNDLESDSTAADSEDEYLLSHSSEEEEDLVGWAAEDEADSELCSGDSLSGDRGVKKRRRHRVGRPRKKPRLEDSPGHMEWEVSSLSDSGESSRRALRRGLTQQVNYCESSSSDSGHRPALKTQRRRQELVSSDYSDASAFSRDSDEECAKQEPGRRKRGRPPHRVKQKPRPGPRSPHRQTDSSPPTSEEERPPRKRPGRLGSDEEEQRPRKGRPLGRVHRRLQS